MQTAQDLLLRIRWGNVARVGGLLALVVVIGLWPRLRASPPMLPPDRATPLERIQPDRSAVRGPASARRAERPGLGRSRSSVQPRVAGATRAKGSSTAKKHSRARGRARTKRRRARVSAERTESLVPSSTPSSPSRPPGPRPVPNPSSAPRPVPPIRPAPPAPAREWGL